MFYHGSIGRLESLDGLAISREHSEIGPEGASVIANALKVNSTLRDLLFNHNNIEVTGSTLSLLDLDTTRR